MAFLDQRESITWKQQRLEQKQLQKQQVREQQLVLVLVLEQQLVLVQEQLLPSCHKQTKQRQQRSQRSKREICSFEIPSKKKRQFPEIVLQSPTKTKQTNV